MKAKVKDTGYIIDVFFDDVFDGYMTEPKSKKDAMQIAREWNNREIRMLYRYDIVLVEE